MEPDCCKRARSSLFPSLYRRIGGARNHPLKLESHNVYAFARARVTTRHLTNRHRRKTGNKFNVCEWKGQALVVNLKHCSDHRLNWCNRTYRNGLQYSISARFPAQGRRYAAEHFLPLHNNNKIAQTQLTPGKLSPQRGVTRVSFVRMRNLVHRAEPRKPLETQIIRKTRLTRSTSVIRARTLRIRDYFIEAA